MRYRPSSGLRANAEELRQPAFYDYRHCHRSRPPERCGSQLAKCLTLAGDVRMDRNFRLPDYPYVVVRFARRDLAPIDLAVPEPRSPGQPQCRRVDGERSVRALNAMDELCANVPHSAN